MGGRSYRDIILGNVDAQAQAFLINIREMFFCLFRVFVCNVQIYMVISAGIHLVFDGTCHNIAGSQ